MNRYKEIEDKNIGEGKKFIKGLTEQYIKSKTSKLMKYMLRNKYALKTKTKESLLPL